MPGGAGSPLQQLIAQFGSSVIVIDASQLAAVNVDHRKLYQGKALALALPRSTAEVSKLLAFCNALRIGVIPQGGNTSYCGGTAPDDSGTQLVLSLRRMNTLREMNPVNDSMIVEAGCILADVQRAAADVGRFFPLSLGAEGSCQIGGNLSTNAGGVNVVRYGMTRDLVLGLEVVLADGRVLSTLQALRKDNTGYDLRHLFIGAEGTLGVITAASLKLFPAPRSVATAFVAVPTSASAVSLLNELRTHCGDLVSSFELIPDIAIDLVVRHLPGSRVPLDGTSPWYVLCEITSALPNEPLGERLEAALAAALEAGLVTNATLAQSERERQDFWFIREHIPEAQRRDGPSLKHDISLPLDRLAAFIASAGDWIRDEIPEGYLVCYGHVGDGNLHFNINQTANPVQSPNAAAGALVSRQNEIRRVIHDRVHELGGSFSAEHGIGRHKVEELERYASPLELELMRAIKRTFDPNGIMNPGKVLRIASLSR
ncbi:MAG: FAD-binding oxidoreductase [Gammaproteobacteria bacterium]|nr:FAD-binding oxidoreductase [Gammaproteobacteria bacterium]